jgi:hypothetical protein
MLVCLAALGGCTPERSDPLAVPVVADDDDAPPATGTGGGGVDDGSTLGTLAVAELTVEGCTVASVDAVQLQPVSDAPALFDRLGQAGNSWVASATIEQSFAVVSSDGHHVSDQMMLAANFNVVSPAGADRFGAAASTLDGDVVYARFKNGGSAPDTIVVATGVSPVALATAEGEGAVVAWAAGGDIHAARVTDGEAQAPAVLQAGAYAATGTLAATEREGDFAVVAAGDGANGLWSTQVTVLAADGSTITSEVLSSNEPQRVAKLVATTSGYVLLLSAGPPASSYLVPLDVDGAPIGEAYRLGGVDSVWDLATDGSSIALPVALSGGGTALLAMDEGFQPEQDPTCLASDAAIQAPGAVAADGDRWAVIYVGAPDGAGESWLELGFVERPTDAGSP